MKRLLLFLLTFLSFNCYSQISFEKGYYIDNNDQRINCLIKNVDWKNNPIKFEFKLSENSELNTITIKSVKEFGIDNISKYIRSSVEIDRSSNLISELSYNKNPEFKEEELFLKVLVAGKITLYEYIDGNLTRFFYGNEDTSIQQLVYKMYKTNENKIGENDRYKQQIWNDLKCPNFKPNRIKNLDYKKTDLVDFFMDYNNCNNHEYRNYEEKHKRDLFNLTIRPRINNSSLIINNSIAYTDVVDFESKISFGVGVEAEFILPFNKNKWSIIFEPTYQYFKTDKRMSVNNVYGGELLSDVDYSSIEIPMGLRHYFFLTNNSKIFVNASYSLDLSTNSTIEFTRNDGSNLNLLDISTRNNFAFGLGYKHDDKYSIEFRYQTPREILADYVFWSSEYETFSMVLGYSLF